MRIKTLRHLCFIWLIAFPLFVWAQAPSVYVIGPEMQPVISKMLESVKTGWSLKNAQIKDGAITASFEHAQKGQVQIVFEHPSGASNDSMVMGGFALSSSKGEMPNDLMKQLKPGVELASKVFEWKEVHEGVDGKQAGAGSGSGTMKEKDRNSVAEVEQIFAAAWSGTNPDWHKDLDRLLEQKGLHPEVLFSVAVNLRDLGELDASKGMFQRTRDRVKQIGESTVRIKMVLGGSLLALGQTTDGLKELDKVLAAKDAAHPIKACRLVDALRLGTGQGEGESFRAWVNSFAVKHPDCSNALTLVAMDFELRGQESEAIKVLEAHTNQDSPDLKALDRLAGLYVKEGKPHDAVRVYRELCSRGNCTDRVRGNLVWAQAGFHRHPKTIAEYVNRGKAEPDNTLLQFEVGVMLHYAQRYSESDQFLVKAKVLWPHDPRILIYVAMNAYRSGRQVEAEKAIEFAFAKAVKKDPDLFYCRAVIFRNTDLPKAIDNLQRYLDVMNPRGGSEEKKAMVNSFMGNMRSELKRREAGEPSRPFADPEESFFGEPPGSPGLAENAIHVLEADQGSAPVPRPRTNVAPVKTGAESPSKPSAEPPEVGDNTIILAGLGLILLAAFSFVMQRRSST